MATPQQAGRNTFSITSLNSDHRPGCTRRITVDRLDALSPHCDARISFVQPTSIPTRFCHVRIPRFQKCVVDVVIVEDSQQLEARQEHWLRRAPATRGDARRSDTRLASRATALACSTALGQAHPEQRQVTSTGHQRDAALVAWVLRRAAGRCECCGQPAPSIAKYGAPFLEMHHVQPLSGGGEDTPANTAAICPNCHREAHYGEQALEVQARLQATLNRLSTTLAQQWPKNLV